MSAHTDHVSIGKSWLAPGARRSFAFSAVGAAVGLVLAGGVLFTAKGTIRRSLPPEYIATVNQRPILRSDFIEQAEIELQRPFKDTTHAERLETLNKMINEELLVQRGEETDLAATDGDVRVALVNGVNLQVDAGVIAEKPSEAQLKNYFKEHRYQYAILGQMRLRDLIDELPSGASPEARMAIAKKAVEALRGGQAPESVERQFGLKDSGQVAREVDVFDYGIKVQLGNELYVRAAQLSTGQVSDPILVRDKLHILFMNKRLAGTAVEYDQVEDKVWSDFLSAARLSVERENLRYLREKSDVIVNSEYQK